MAALAQRYPGAGRSPIAGDSRAGRRWGRVAAGKPLAFGIGSCRPPKPETQIRFRHLRIRVDLGWRQWKVAVEYDGIQHWADRRQRPGTSNASHYSEAAGWAVVRVDAESLSRPEQVVERVRAKAACRGLPRLTLRSGPVYGLRQNFVHDTHTADGSDADAASELLRDAFTRLIEHVENITEHLTDELAAYRPTGTANSIAWLLWHSARIQDAQLAQIAGIDQVWFTGVG